LTASARQTLRLSFESFRATDFNNRRLSLLHFQCVVCFEAYGRAEPGEPGHCPVCSTFERFKLTQTIVAGCPCCGGSLYIQVADDGFVNIQHRDPDPPDPDPDPRFFD
jgi:hypothetical protein